MRQDDTLQNQRSFFISYTASDQLWAEWIAMQLEQAGYTLFIQAWDFPPGTHFVAAMDHAAKHAECTLLVLSPAYLRSDFAFAEWAAAWRHDPKGIRRRVLPVRVEPCDLDGLLAPIVYLDLVGLDEVRASSCLLEGVHEGRRKPSTVAFPGLTSPHKDSFPASFPAIWHIPYPRNPFFTGRDDLLEQVHTHLHAAHTATLGHPQAISGLGGVGKTQVALEYAYRYRQEYQAILWVHAETTEALNASYTQIAALLSLPQKEMQEQEVIVLAVKAWLQNQGQWLLLRDNVEDLAVVQPFLPTACPGHLILTTRVQRLGTFAHRLEVETLEKEIGALLLLRRAGVINLTESLDSALPSDRLAALRLVELLGGLPLALDQAGAYIEATDASLTEYSQFYQTQRAHLLALRNGPQGLPGTFVDNHPEPVTTTWALSFAQVTQINPRAADVLRICAFLASDEIPEELLIETLQTPLTFMQEQRINEAEAAENTGKRAQHMPGMDDRSGLPSSVPSEATFPEAVALLRAYSLIQRKPAAKTLSMHRLIQAVLQETMTDAERQVWEQRTLEAIQAMLPSITFVSWQQCELYVPHAQECVQRAQANPKRAMLEICFWLGSYLLERHRTAEAEPYVRQALRWYEQHLGETHPHTAASLNNLAALYKSQGRYADAEPLYQRALAISEHALGQRHPTTRQIHTNYVALLETMRRKRRPFFPWRRRR